MSTVVPKFKDINTWHFLENCPGRPLYNCKSFIHVQVNVIENLKQIPVAMSSVTHDLTWVNKLTKIGFM